MRAAARTRCGVDPLGAAPAAALTSAIPYEPTSLDNPRADEQARERQWPLLLAFLNRV